MCDSLEDCVHLPVLEGLGGTEPQVACDGYQHWDLINIHQIRTNSKVLGCLVY